MVSWLNGLLYGIGGIAATCIVLLVTLQEKLVYVPVIPGMIKGYPITPARLRMKYEDVWLTTKDGIKLHSWFIKVQPPAQGPTILFFQENAGSNETRIAEDICMSQYGWEFLTRMRLDIAHRLEFVDLMLQRLNCNVFMLSYRGYGASDGFPSQHGLILDAQAALDHLLQRTDIDCSRIAVFGRSLGGAVGSALVANNPGKVSALILENTFTSILDMAGVMMPVLKYVIAGTGSGGLRLLNFLVRSPWNTIDLVHKVQEPVLFLSGLKDEMVPPSHMRRLYNAAESNVDRQLVEFPTGMHMDTWHRGGNRYWRVVQLFLEQHSCGAQSRSDTSGITSLT